MRTTFFILLLIFSLSKKEDFHEGKTNDLEKLLLKLEDSIQVNNIIIKYLFKYQILAHSHNRYDTSMIANKVYHAHQQLWDSCYGMIFGESNASRFNNAEGMIEWNRTLYPENKAFFDQRAKEILSLNLDSILQINLKRFSKMVPYTPSSRISILFTPLEGIGFGGCSNQQFCLELNNKDYDIPFTLKNGLPHELNHMVYEPFRNSDSSGGTALGQAIDEGFACYFMWEFNDRKIPKRLLVEKMTAEEWNWYLEHEKSIYNKVKPFFNDRSGDNPLLRNSKYKIFPDAPKTLFYWLGFRIVEMYVKKHGKDSWKNLYHIPISTVLKESGYESYINRLK